RGGGPTGIQTLRANWKITALSKWVGNAAALPRPNGRLTRFRQTIIQIVVDVSGQCLFTSNAVERQCTRTSVCAPRLGSTRNLKTVKGSSNEATDDAGRRLLDRNT